MGSNRTIKKKKMTWNRLVSEIVNKAVDEKIEEALSECRSDLQLSGRSNAVIEKKLLKAKSETQAQFLPLFKKKMDEALKEKKFELKKESWKIKHKTPMDIIPEGQEQDSKESIKHKKKRKKHKRQLFSISGQSEEDREEAQKKRIISEEFVTSQRAFSRRRYQ